jgi:hypothetical protein
MQEQEKSKECPYCESEIKPKHSSQYKIYVYECNNCNKIWTKWEEIKTNEIEQCRNCYFFKNKDSEITKDFLKLIKDLTKIKGELVYCSAYLNIMEFNNDKRWIYAFRPKKYYKVLKNQQLLFPNLKNPSLIKGSQDSLWHFYKEGFLCKKYLNFRAGNRKLFKLFNISAIEMFCIECNQHYFFTKSKLTDKCPKGHQFKHKMGNKYGK